ncbi:Hydroxymethylpyrimidine ABC transporter, transmembrane component [Rubellimicrobium mesophilum DSM 19309]|uniref:Hydroxymethylpyrimidine ABC transporter, transmembrane component n=1 Tax=Rubellimicrobium mesophilum DSM 19309 TaxID=442562 RepID=A0A017HMC6_9RHOB|nr:ABC transporter permease [Rubellimicrobium mesophilum]EYD75323.1 Hydroxymethylpyrimidine ABC transporter, transmembrane component [Rubellimicrobium mesophilum DSM 19309]
MAVTDTIDAASVVPRTEAQIQRRYRLISVAITVVILGLWEIVPALGLVNPIILPQFSKVVWALGTLVIQDFFLQHFTVTLTEILLGFVLGTAIGLALGIALAVWPAVKQVTYPFVVGFQAIPKIVFAPLFIAWFGFDQTSKVVMAIVIAFFPVLINTMVGLESVPQDAKKLMRSLRATPLQTFWKVSLPHALPIIFAGVKAALTFAVIGAIVGEFVGASEGLGYLLDLYNNQLQIDRVFAVIVVLAAIGALGYFLLEWLDRKLIFWREDENR